jgi:RNA methyltransferase, TrmH family
MCAMLSKRIVKYIQSLSHKKLREAHGKFIAETPKVVAEFLAEGNYSCSLLCADTAWLSAHQGLLQKVLPQNIYVVDPADLEKISQLQTPHSVVAVFDIRPPTGLPTLTGKLSLMLDGIQDPGNMGTIIRNADWFGIEIILCSANCVDCYNPKVVQASMGSLARVNILYGELDSFLEANSHISVYAATLSGRPVPSLGTLKEGIILIGNESRGISRELLERGVTQVTIPRYGKAESLNAAVATAIILSHIKGAT